MTPAVTGTPDRPADAALWRSVAETVTDVLLPALPPGFEQDTARQLAGLARYALDRPPDASADRAQALGSVLGLAEPVPLTDALRAAGGLLAASHQADADPAEQARAIAIRRLLLEHLRADAAAAAPLLETFAGHAPSADEPKASEPAETARLRSWLQAKLGAPVDALVVAVMTGGHSRRMLSVRATADGNDHDLIVRVEQGGLFATAGEPEAKCMAAVAAAGVPTARVRWVEQDPAVLGQPFFVMDRVPGTPALVPGMMEQYVQVLHRLHRLDPGIAADALGPVPASAEVAVGDLVDHWLGVYRRSTGAPVPLLEDAGAWLRRHLRPTGPVALVHGDPGPGNFLHDGRAITALTDWEFAHYGDPAEDWTYLALRGRRLLDADGWRRRLRETVGVAYDDRSWICWDAFNQFRGACVNLTALQLFRTGVRTTPNLLAIGTAVQLRFLGRLVELLRELDPDRWPECAG